MNPESPITNSTPGPSPWYLRLPGAPCIAGFRWEERNGTGGTKTVLVGPQGPVAALGFQNYVKVLNPVTLLIWYQRSQRSSDPTYPVELLVLHPWEMKPLRGDLDFMAISPGQTPIALESVPFARCELDTTHADQILPAEFPKALQEVDEILILCDSSAISATGPNLAMMVAKPKNSTIQLYPQDWFNHSNADFGYEWVTRVARDPRTGRIHGDGIRIAAFVLDETLRGVEGGFGPAGP